MYRSKQNNLLGLLILPLALLAGCAQQSVEQRPAAATASDDGLVPRQTGLDSVSAAYAFDMSGAKVYLEPVGVAYTKRFGRPGSPLRAKDYELADKDLEKLQDLMGQTLTERFLAPRNSQLVASTAEAD